MELNYQGKKTIQEINLRSKKETKNIEYNQEDSFVIQGDNFNVMSALLNSGWEEKIDLIYIDPPFSTNSDFIVSSKRVSTVSKPKNGIIAYSDKMKESIYIEYIRERLVLIHRLLSQRGSLYFHIDNKIGHYIKIILDEIFGSNNFLNDITRKKSNPKNFYRKAYGNEKDVIYYLKNCLNQKFHQV